MDKQTCLFHSKKEEAQTKCLDESNKGRPVSIELLTLAVPPTRVSEIPLATEQSSQEPQCA